VMAEALPRWAYYSDLLKEHIDARRPGLVRDEGTPFLAAKTGSRTTARPSFAPESPQSP
jgi:hypothetical protein